MIVEQLANLLGPRGIVTDSPDRYTRDWSGDHAGRALAIVRPADTAEVAATLRLCHQAGIPVVPQGGNTGLVAGGIPTDDGREILLSLERLDRVREIDPLNYSLVAEAGCILSDLHRAAADADRLFPLSLGAQDSCRIGGNVATNAGGINVLRYGMTRDLVLGLEAVLPDGRIWNGLRSLRKNNTGYDLKQLFIGAEGTTGIVTAAAFKLFPRPTQTETAILGVPTLDAALALYAAARRDLADLLSAFELMARPCLDLTLAHSTDLRDPLATAAPFTILLEATASGLVDLADLVERFLAARLDAGDITDGALAQSTTQARDFWRLREDLVEAQHRQGRHLRTDISVRISDLPRFVAAADAALSEVTPAVRLLTYGHVGDGNLHYNVLMPPGLDPAQAAALIAHCEDLLFQVVDRFAGSISAEHGIGRLKRDHLAERLDPVEADLIHRVKAAMDPTGLMSPGRILL